MYLELLFTCCCALFFLLLAKLYKYVARYVTGSFGRVLATSVKPLINGSPSAMEILTRRLCYISIGSSKFSCVRSSNVNLHDAK